MLSKILATINSNPKESHVMEVITRMQNADMRNIYVEVYKTDITKLSSIVTSIVYLSIKTLLKNWKGFYRVMNQEDMKNDLLQYLKENLDYVISTADGRIIECELNNTIESEKVSVELCCPYRKLNSIFYTGIHPSTNDILNLKPSNYCIPQRYDMTELVNWPFMETNIQFPDFKITRSNIFSSEFKLIKLASHYKPTVNSETMSLKYKQLTKNVESFPNTFILTFMKQLRHKLGLLDCLYPSNVKISILSVLTAFEKDIALCTEEIDTNTEYFCHLSKGYVRYLAMPMDEKKSKMDGLIKYEDQIKLDKNCDNIRLQQIIYPTAKFHLSTFNIMYDTDKKDDGYVFSIAQEMVHNLFQYISFKCCLCLFQCSGANSKRNLEQHLNTVHAVEADWHCPKCKKGFPMQILSSRRWQHECVKKKKKIV